LDLEPEPEPEPEPFIISASTPDGRTIGLEVDPNDTIAEVKERIQEDEGIPVEDQRLLFHGDELDNSKSLLDHGIQHGDSLNLLGNTMTVHVQHFNGKKLTVQVMPTNSLGDLKEVIEELSGTPTHQQFVLFGPKLLSDDNQTLEAYKIKNGSTLKLEKMKIYVQTSTGKFPLAVEPITTVQEIKGMIETKASIATNDQILKFKDQGLEDGDATLQDLNIGHKDVLQVEVSGGPTYRVQMGDYVSAFDYVASPRKSPKKKEGTRAKVKNSMAGFYGTTSGTDREIGQWSHNVDEDT